MLPACLASETFPGRTGFSSTASIAASRSTSTCGVSGWVCKFWLAPVALAANHGFSARELHVIRSYIEEYLGRLVEAWNEHCGP